MNILFGHGRKTRMDMFRWVDISPLPSDRGSLSFNERRCTLLKGPRLDGYVIGLGSVYALGIFVGDTEIVFNRRLGDLSRKAASNLFTVLEIEPFELFPLKFVTDFHFADGTPIQGLFSIDL